MTLSHSSPPDEVWVALDTETTGLDPESDRIIEVGAVKFRGDEVLGVFQSFVNPGEAAEQVHPGLYRHHPARDRSRAVLS